MAFFKRLASFRFKREFILAAGGSLLLPLAALVACFVLRPVRVLPGVLLGAGLVVQVGFLMVLFNTVLYPIYEALEETRQNGQPPATLHTMVERVLGYYQGVKDREYATLLLQKQAEIDALQSQINPHFLHNTLDSVRGLAMEEHAEKTCDMVGSLSRFLRYTISQKNDMISLDQELDSVKNYMNIQRYRFDDRFALKMSIEPEDERILQYKIPKLTLQPLIENAIYHGLDRMVSGGLIEISCTVTQSRLMIVVADNGVGLAAEDLAALNRRLQEGTDDAAQMRPSGQGSGVALNNVHARIRLMYGERYGLTLYSLPDLGTQVQISLPLREGLYEI